MQTRRLTGLGLGVLATAALALTGCAGGTATPGASASAAPGSTTSAAAADPAAAAALGTAATALDATSYQVTVTAGPGVTMTAQVDPPNGKGIATIALTGANADLRITTLLIGSDLYAQIPGITKAGTWTHVDVSRLPDGANIGLRPGQVDPAYTAQLLTSATDVRSTGAHSYRGTLDLTKAVGLTGVTQVSVTGLGDSATKVPFTVTLDDQGRPAEMTIQPPAMKGTTAQPIVVRYSGYGTTVTADRPAAAEITEAPDNFYAAIGGK